jgi:hypothetical protein
VGWFLRDAPWQVGLLIGIGLMGFGAYRLDGGHGGAGSWVLVAAGAFGVVRSLLRARGGSGGGTRR